MYDCSWRAFYFCLFCFVDQIILICISKDLQFKNETYQVCKNSHGVLFSSFCIQKNMYFILSLTSWLSLPSSLPKFANVIIVTCVWNRSSWPVCWDLPAMAVVFYLGADQSQWDLLLTKQMINNLLLFSFLQVTIEVHHMQDRLAPHPCLRTLVQKAPKAWLACRQDTLSLLEMNFCRAPWQMLLLVMEHRWLTKERNMLKNMYVFEQ